MTREDKSLLLAMCIGDGCISRGYRAKTLSGLRYHSFKLTHCERQLNYLMYKRQIMCKALDCSLPKVTFFDNRGFPGVKFEKGHRYFRILRKKLYKNRVKVISRSILDKLTAHGIAIWYMDDGNLSAKKRGGKIHAYELFINTHLTMAQNQVIIDYFLECWGIQFKQVKNNGHYRLRVSTKEARKFIKIVEPYTIPEMQYKISMQPIECDISSFFHKRPASYKNRMMI